VEAGADEDDALDEPPADEELPLEDLLDEQALSASTAATPATASPMTRLRMGGTAFRWCQMAENWSDARGAPGHTGMLCARTYPRFR
jgi:hypothetical protein